MNKYLYSELPEDRGVSSFSAQPELLLQGLQPRSLSSGYVSDIPGSL